MNSPPARPTNRPPEPSKQPARGAGADSAESDLEKAKRQILMLAGAMPVVDALAGQESVTVELTKLQGDLRTVHQALQKGLFNPALAAQLAAAEETLLARDAALPDQWTRKKLERAARGDVMPVDVEGKKPGRKLAPEALIAYARLLNTQPNQHRLDRTVFLVQQLITGADGALKPLKDVKPLLQGLSTSTDVTPDTLQKACTFFEGARQRLTTLATLDSLFESGFILDTEGYRISLREHLLEPEIIHASLELELAFRKRLNELATQAKVAPDAVEKRLEEARRKVDEIFNSSQAESPEAAPAEKAKRRPPPPAPKAKAGTPATRKGTPAKASKARKILNAVVAVFIAIGAPTAAYFVYDAFFTKTLEELKPAELQALSPLLVSGHLTVSPVNRVFFGQVRPADWVTLARADRMKVARAIRDELLRRGVRMGYVSRDEVVVIRIGEGHVLQVN